MLYHEEERDTVYPILRAVESYPDGTPFRLTFPEGDCYVCTYFTSYDSENGLELDDPLYDEWYEIFFEIQEVVEPGPNGSEEYMSVLVYYQRVPERIETLDGTCVFSLGEGGK